MKIIKTALTVFLSLGLLWAGDSDGPEAVLQLDSSFSLPAGESKLTDIKVSVPNGYGIVVGHSGKSFNVIANFAQNASSGFLFSIEKMPSGTKKGNNLLAKGNIVFQVRVSELKGAKSGTSLNSDVVFNYQLCALADGKCLAPDGISKPVTVTISEDKKIRTLAGAKNKGGGLSPIKWAPSLDKAIQSAKSKGQNIYVIVTAPSWCGACQMMERETFDKANVQKVLNSDFVPLQVLDNSPDIDKFDIQGFPTSFILDPKGNELTQQVGGIRASQFLSFVANFRKPQKDDDDDDNSDPTKDETKTKKLTWEVWRKKSHSGGADWTGFLGTMTGTKEECKQACGEAEDCHSFFIVTRGQLDIAPKGSNKFWKHFRPGECVFLRGKPSPSDAKQADLFVKKVNGKKAYNNN